MDETHVLSPRQALVPRMIDRDAPTAAGSTPAQTDFADVPQPRIQRTWRDLWRDLCYLAAMLLLAGLWLLNSFRQDEGHRSSARRENCRDRLKQIALALHNYHDTYGCFPPAYLADAKGKPLHSWRVLILPFIDGNPIYNRYRFDEAWNGPNNSRLHGEAIDSFYHCPSDSSDPLRRCETSYVAIVGDETAWPGATSISITDFSDGIANTIHVIEIADSGIHWMEPRDLTVAEARRGINARPANGLVPGSKHTRGANAVFCDGTVKSLPDHLSLQQLRSLMTRGAGDDPGGW